MVAKSGSGRKKLGVVALAGGLLALTSAVAVPQVAHAAGNAAAGDMALVWDVAAQRVIGLDVLSYRLAEARWLILGEQHDNPAHHRLQARLVGAVVAAGRRPAVAVEMLEQPQQAEVDRLQKHSAPVKSWGKALRWEQRGWPIWSSYQPIFAQVQANGLPVVAANLDRATLRHVAQGADPEIPESMRNEQIQAVVEGHCGLITAEQAPPMVRAQVARDRAMAQAMQRGAGTHQDGAILIAGTQHGRKDVGVPWHLSALGVDGTAGAVVSVGMMEWPEETPTEGAENEKAAAVAGHRPFDYVILTPRIERADPCEALKRHFGPGKGQGKKPTTSGS